MNNIQNGGLISVGEEQLILSNIGESEGMVFCLEDNRDKQLYDILPWFMNEDYKNNSLYYSDGLKKGYVYKMNLDSRQEQIVIEEPAYLLQKSDDYLYYIHVENKKLYRYNLENKKMNKVMDDEVKDFILQEDALWYSNDKGIFALEVASGHCEKISKSRAIRLVCEDDILACVNKDKDYEVQYIEITSGKEKCIAESMANYINIHNNMIFFSNVKDNAHLYRYSISNDLSIKFVPERTQNIHIVNGKIYYFNNDYKQWREVSLQGGKPKSLIL